VERRFEVVVTRSARTIAGGDDDVCRPDRVAGVGGMPQLTFEPVAHDGTAQAFAHSETKARARERRVVAHPQQQRSVGVDFATAIYGAEIISMSEPLLAAHGDSAVCCWFTAGWLGVVGTRLDDRETAPSAQAAALKDGATAL
jgi:hypothetical protein